MFTTLLSVSLFIALVHPVFAQSGFAIDTPTLVQCQQTQITWSATGSPPYDLLVVAADDVCGEALEDLGYMNNTATLWTVNIAAGTQVVLSVQDSAGNEAWSGAVTVGGNSNSSCLTSAPCASTSAVSGTTLTSGGTATTTSSSPTSSVFNPAGAANAGLVPSSGVLSARPFSAITLFSSAVLAFITSSL